MDAWANEQLFLPACDEPDDRIRPEMGDPERWSFIGNDNARRVWDVEVDEDPYGGMIADVLLRQEMADLDPHLDDDPYAEEDREGDDEAPENLELLLSSEIPF